MSTPAKASSRELDQPWLALTQRLEHPEVRPGPATCLEIVTSTEQFPDRVAVHYLGRSLTFGDVLAYAGRVQERLLGLGIRPGDRIVIALNNTPQFIMFAMAAWSVGAIVVPVNPMYRHKELTAILRDCAPSLAVCGQDTLSTMLSVAESLDMAFPVILDGDELFAREQAPRQPVDGELARGGVEPSTVALGSDDPSGTGRGFRQETTASPHDVALLCYTSGTTGPPKGAMVTHGALAFTARVYRDWLSLTDQDVIFGAAPLAHITGVACNLITPLLVGCPVVLMPRFEPRAALSLMEKHRASLLLGSTTIFTSLMVKTSREDSDRLDSLRRAYSGGAPVAPAVVDQFREHFGVEIRTCYGLTETCGPSHFSLPDGVQPVDEQTGALTVGLPVYGTDVRIVGPDGTELPPGNEGEIVIRGPQLFAGYWEAPAETEHALRDGWLHTGDVGVMDRDGWFYVVDRIKDQINASGYKVWPREVEDVLMEFSGVVEAAVVGVPDPYRGETVVAAVSLAPEAEVSEDQLVRHCRELLAAYKVPVRISIMEELPKTFSGKIQRGALRTALSE